MLKKLSLSVIGALMAMSMTACDADEQKNTASADSAAPVAKVEKTATSAENKTNANDADFNIKVAKSMGAFYGKNILTGIEELEKEADFKIDKKVLVDSFVSAVNGKTELTEEEMENTMKEFQVKIQQTMKEKKEAAAEKNLKDGQAFLEKNKNAEGVKVTDSGLQYKIITLGTGEKPVETDTIRVTYRGTTIDGKVFDESKNPVEFKLNQVVKGWIEAFQLFPVGTKATIYIPSELGYGKFSPSPAIPENSVLVFDVELLDIVKPEAPKAEIKTADETSADK